jgi:hypothetical protein
MRGSAVDVVWAVLAVLAVALELAAVLTKRAPTLTSTLRSLVRSRTGTAVLFLAWAWFGWHSFAR